MIILLALLLSDPCLVQACSNDPMVLGDEQVCFTQPTDDDLDHYDVVNVDTAATCAVALPVPGQETVCLLLSGTPCLAENDLARIAVRACDTGGLCSNLSGAVEFLPYMCIENGAERPCFPGAPCRLPVSRGCE